MHPEILELQDRLEFKVQLVEQDLRALKGLREQVVLLVQPVLRDFQGVQAPQALVEHRELLDKRVLPDQWVQPALQGPKEQRGHQVQVEVQDQVVNLVPRELAVEQDLRVPRDQLEQLALPVLLERAVPLVPQDLQGPLVYLDQLGALELLVLREHPAPPVLLVPVDRLACLDRQDPMVIRARPELRVQRAEQE